MIKLKKNKDFVERITTDVTPFSKYLSDYDWIKLFFEYQSIAYNPTQKTIDGDFVFRFPEHIFIVRTQGKHAELLIDEPIKNIVWDCSFDDTKTCINIRQGKMHPVLLLFDKKFRINHKITLKKLFLAYYYLRSIMRPFRRNYEKMEQNILRKQKDLDIRNILILQGSSRGKEGYTQVYLDYLLEGLKQQLVTIKIIYIKEKHVEFCKGCFSCWYKTNGKCVIQDDVGSILPEIEWADIVLLAMPVFIGGVPAKLKAVIDKWITLVYPYEKASSHNWMTTHPRRNFKRQYLAGITICALPEQKQAENITHYLSIAAELFSVKFLGNIVIPNAIELDNNPIYCKRKHKIAQVLKTIGYQIATKPIIDEGLAKKILKLQKVNIRKWRNNANLYIDYLLQK
ncbi:MAG: flavodoxin family protein [Candidatus Omnitrophota bacterium]